MFDGQLLLGTLIIVIAVVFHAAGLVSLAGLITKTASSAQFFQRRAGLMCLLGLAVLMIIAMHTVEAWGWATVYVLLEEFDDFGRSLYFSIVTATTLGYGDITLSDQWQLLSTFEAMGGLILFGASTAFLMELMRHLFAEPRESGMRDRSRERA